ncbi:MAG TPA: 3-keto-5-aminohexanoate cleavage protein [Azospirillum sp.]|nr:3-keto-5-aminohexanoate cleavage protein [Azospirillum sp.]
MTPLVIAAAPNGARRGKADHPAIPLTAEETAREAARCREAGAGMLHLHVRDAAGRHTLDPDAYREAMAAVRREAGPDLLIQATTEAVGIYTPEQQMAAIRDLHPEAFSAAVRELVPDTASEAAAARFYAEQASAGTLVQHILYDTADVARFEDLVARGVIPDTGCSVLFVLGRYAPGQRSAPRDLLPFLSASAGRFAWMVCAFGALEGACAATAAALGGHARVGFENNLCLADGSVAPDTAALVAQVATAAPLLGRAPADGNAARQLLGST